MPTKKLAQVKGKAARRDGQAILAMEKERQALELRKAGATFAVIAERIGYANAGGAYKAVQRSMGRIIQEPVMELRTLQMQRLDEMLIRLWPKIQGGDEKAMGMALQIMDKQDRLQGTEQPATQVYEHKYEGVLVIEGDRDDYIAGMQRMAEQIGVEVPALPPIIDAESEEVDATQVPEETNRD